MPTAHRLLILASPTLLAAAPPPAVPYAPRIEARGALQPLPQRRMIQFVSEPMVQDVEKTRETPPPARSSKGEGAK